MAKFCPNCGNPIDEGAVFCDNCGCMLTAQPNPQPEQPYEQPEQQYAQPSQQPLQPTQQYAPYSQPMQQPYQSNQPYSQSDVQPPKKKTGLIVGLILAGVAVTFFIVILVVLIIPMMNPHKENPLPTQATESVTEPMTTAATEAPTVAPTEAPTEAPTKAPTEAPTEPKADLPYVDSLGKINDYDFAWISDAMSGSLTGEFLSNDELLGKWKGEFIFDGIWELVYVTIDADGTVTVEPYQINYGDGWEDESGDPSYSFNGSFDINRVFGSGSYGSIDLYQFLSSGGTQYGIGELKTAGGSKAKIYLVRP